MKVFLTFVLLLVFLQSCSVTPSYDVRVVNNSDESIVVKFVSQYSLPAFPTQEVTLKKGESAVIITTPDIAKETSDLCRVIATSISAEKVRDSSPSSLIWCTDVINCELVDIGQYQFLVNYTSESFVN